MSEMIERMAKAIHKARQEMGYGGQADWEFEPDFILAVHRHAARAALAEAEQPTVEMIAAGGEIVEFGGYKKTVARQTYEDMIRAALKEAQEGNQERNEHG